MTKYRRSSVQRYSDHRLLETLSRLESMRPALESAGHIPLCKTFATGRDISYAGLHECGGGHDS
jgi:hypothetical protein